MDRSMIRTFLHHLCLVLFFNLMTGGAAMAKSGQDFNFEYKFKPGQELFYLVSVHGQVDVETPQGTQSNPIHIEMEIHQKVEDIQGELATIAMVVSSAKTFQGSDSAVLPEEGQKSVLTMDPSGKVQYISGTGGWKGSEFSQLIFPRRPINPGHSWVNETQTTEGILVKTRTKYTFTGFEVLQNKDCAVFSSELFLDGDTGNPSNAAASTTGKIFFYPESGQVIKTTADSRFSFLLPIEGAGNLQAHTVTTLHIEMRLMSE